MSFQTQVDIANLALQFLGLPRISTTLGFTENSQRAQEMAAAYGKLKRAELRRTVFPWAIKRAVIRPMDTNTMIMTPTLWDSQVTYFQGSVVADASGFLWYSRIRNNLGNDPQNTPWAWDAYFGPLTVGLYNSTNFYFAGELVYTAAGDGTYNVYQSSVSGNGLDPSLSNQWSSDATYFMDNVVQVFAAWSSGTTYSKGQSVQYTDGNIYTSLVNSNLNNIPANTINTDWALMPILQLIPTTTGAAPGVGQPITQTPQSSPITEWNSDTVYSIGSFVMFNASMYCSLINNNSENQPNTSASDWVLVTGGTSYQSLIDLNINNNPANAPVLWSSSTTYSIGNQVGGSDGLIYTSLANSNLNNNPTTDGGVHWQNTGVLNPWTTVFTLGGGNQQWLQIGGAGFPNGVGLTNAGIVYPIGSGPSSQSQTRNVYRCPAGYLREAPQDPKAGSTSFLGAPSGLWYNDWEHEGNYIVTRSVDPIIYRFVADVVDVTQFDDMFCAGLAYRLALSTAPVLTNSNTTKQMVAQEYQKFMGEGRILGGIESGATEPPEDDFVVARL